MRKFFAGVLCAVIALSSFAMSASAEESFKERFIKALMEDENSWVVSDVNSIIQFIDLNSDGEKEFLVEFPVFKTLKTNVYTLNDEKITKVNYNNLFDPNMSISVGALKKYNNDNDSVYADFWTPNSSALPETGIIPVDYNFFVKYDKGSNEIFEDVFSYKKGDKYYSKDNTEITEEEYNNINTEAIAGYTEEKLDYNSDSIVNYTKLSSSDKKAKLEWLYDGIVNEKEEPAPDTDKPDPTPSKPDTDKPENKPESSPNSTPTSSPNSSPSSNTPTSPKTGVQNNYAVLFAAAIVSGAAIALSQKKRRKDI